MCVCVYSGECVCVCVYAGVCVCVLFVHVCGTVGMCVCWDGGGGVAYPCWGLD